MRNEAIYSLALSRIPGLGTVSACNLVRTVGSVTSIFENRKELPQLIPGVTDKLVSLGLS